MNIQNATDIKIGSTSASKVMLGTTLVWPSLPYELQYKSPSEGGWGNHYVNDGDNISLTGNQWFMMINSSTNVNITFNYTWSFTGSVTLVDTEVTDVGDPRGDNLPLMYLYNITGQAQLVITDNATGNVVITADFNA